MNFSVGSMFAGIGGICLAFKNAGYNIKWANEIDTNACKTYRLNFPNIKLYEKDVRNIEKPEDLGEVDIITSGFPCQAFSIAGYRNGFDDPRGNLFFETARFIKILKPKAYLLENVKNLKGHDKGNTFKIISETMQKHLGYSFIPFVLNSSEYGNIPQNRERIYIVGFRNKSANSFEIPKPLKRNLTIHDLLSKEKQPDKYYYKKDHHYYSKLKKKIKNRDTVYQWRRVYVRENKNNVCPTLTANMGTGGHNVPLILDDFGIRKFTPRECARFQGFPDSFTLPKDMAESHLYKQIGNSVVVPVVERIAKEISTVLKSKPSKKPDILKENVRRYSGT